MCEGESLEIVNEFIYLGVKFSSTGTHYSALQKKQTVNPTCDDVSPKYLKYHAI